MPAAKATTSSMSFKTMASFIALMALLLGSVAAMFLASRSSDIRQQAYTAPSQPQCMVAGQCIGNLFCPTVGAIPQPNSRCQTDVVVIPPGQGQTITLRSCSASSAKFEVPLYASSCAMNGVAYVECNPGYVRLGNGCVKGSNPPVPSPVIVRPSPYPSPVVIKPSPTTTVVSCGNSCTSPANCAAGQTCFSNRCVLTTCLTGAPCNPDKCSYIAPSPMPPVTKTVSCGSACSSNAMCPSNQACNGGRCVIAACMNGAPCSYDQCTIIGPTAYPNPM